MEALKTWAVRIGLALGILVFGTGALLASVKMPGAAWPTTAFTAFERTPRYSASTFVPAFAATL